jgi:hypothetical protein
MTITGWQTPNRKLTDEERTALAVPILQKVRAMIETASNGDEQLAFAVNRYVYARLQVDERGLSLERKTLKQLKKVQQNGKCPICGGALPESGAVLDRLNAMDRYTDANTRVICPACDARIQDERRYS